MVQKLKENKGITLIALVVIIVILIILAAITINVALGEEGLIQRANKAKEIHNISRIAVMLNSIGSDDDMDLDGYLAEVEKVKEKRQITSVEKVDENNAIIIVEDKYKFVATDEGDGEIIIKYEETLGGGNTETGKIEVSASSEG